VNRGVRKREEQAPLAMVPMISLLWRRLLLAFVLICVAIAGGPECCFATQPHKSVMLTHSTSSCTRTPAFVTVRMHATFSTPTYLQQLKNLHLQLSKSVLQ
jgi:hypothetical protein